MTASQLRFGGSTYTCHHLRVRRSRVAKTKAFSTFLAPPEIPTPITGHHDSISLNLICAASPYLRDRPQQPPVRPPPKPVRLLTGHSRSMHQHRISLHYQHFFQRRASIDLNRNRNLILDRSQMSDSSFKCRRASPNESRSHPTPRTPNIKTGDHKQTPPSLETHRAEQHLAE